MAGMALEQEELKLSSSSFSSSFASLSLLPAIAALTLFLQNSLSRVISLTLYRLHQQLLFHVFFYFVLPSLLGGLPEKTIWIWDLINRRLYYFSVRSTHRTPLQFNSLVFQTDINPWHPGPLSPFPVISHYPSFSFCIKNRPIYCRQNLTNGRHSYRSIFFVHGQISQP